MNGGRPRRVEVRLVEPQDGGSGRTWGVYLDGRLAEGGFFSYAAAERAADEWRAGAEADR